MERQKANEVPTESGAIICPWCYGAITSTEDETSKCPICNRE